MFIIHYLQSSLTTELINTLFETDTRDVIVSVLLYSGIRRSLVLVLQYFFFLARRNLRVRKRYSTLVFRNPLREGTTFHPRFELV